MTTTSFDAARTRRVRLPAWRSAPDAARRRSPRELVAFPVLLGGLILVGLGYLGLAWLMLSWLVAVV